MYNEDTSSIVVHDVTRTLGCFGWNLEGKTVGLEVMVFPDMDSTVQAYQVSEGGEIGWLDVEALR